MNADAELAARSLQPLLPRLTANDFRAIRLIALERLRVENMLVENIPGYRPEKMQPLLEVTPLVSELAAANLRYGIDLLPRAATHRVLALSQPGERNRTTSVPPEMQQQIYEAAELKRARKGMKLRMLSGGTGEDQL